MALSFEAVKEAYKVFNELKNIPNGVNSIPAWPQDMIEWSREQKENPPLNEVIGYDRKADNGWENLLFIVSDPSDELKTKFNELKSRVWNTSFSKPYLHNKNLWAFGWF